MLKATRSRKGLRMYIASRITDGSAKAAGGRPDHPRRGLDRFGFAAEEQGDRAAGVGEVQRLEGAVQHQYRDFIHMTSNDTERPAGLSTAGRRRQAGVPPARRAIAPRVASTVSQSPVRSRA